MENDQRNPAGRPRPPQAAERWEVPTGSSKGAPCQYPRRESRLVKLDELHHKGLRIKAVFFLAPLARRPCIGESP